MVDGCSVATRFQMVSGCRTNTLAPWHRSETPFSRSDAGSAAGGGFAARRRCTRTSSVRRTDLHRLQVQFSIGSPKCTQIRALHFSHHLNFSAGRDPDMPIPNPCPGAAKPLEKKTELSPEEKLREMEKDQKASGDGSGYDGRLT